MKQEIRYHKADHINEPSLWHDKFRNILASQITSFLTLKSRLTGSWLLKTSVKCNYSFAKIFCQAELHLTLKTKKSQIFSRKY